MKNWFYAPEVMAHYNLDRVDRILWSPTKATLYQGPVAINLSEADSKQLRDFLQGCRTATLPGSAWE